MRLTNLPVYASNGLFGPAAFLGGGCLSFPSATLGFGWLVRPFHLVLSFSIPAASRQTRGTSTLQTVRLHHCALCPAMILSALCICCVRDPPRPRANGRIAAQRTQRMELWKPKTFTRQVFSPVCPNAGASSCSLGSLRLNCSLQDEHDGTSGLTARGGFGQGSRRNRFFYEHNRTGR